MTAREVFIKFRGGNGFVVSLTAFLGLWFAARSVVPFDQDFGVLNIVLSTEASLATCFLIDQQSKQTEADRKLLHAILALQKEEAEQLDDIEETLEGKDHG